MFLKFTFLKATKKWFSSLFACLDDAYSWHKLNISSNNGLFSWRCLGIKSVNKYSEGIKNLLFITEIYRKKQVLPLKF